jgi:hypothetical protein
MSARKRRLPYEGGPRGGFTFSDGEVTNTSAGARPKHNVVAPEIDICSYPIEVIGPAFDLNSATSPYIFYQWIQEQVGLGGLLPLGRISTFRGV